MGDMGGGGTGTVRYGSGFPYSGKMNGSDWTPVNHITPQICNLNFFFLHLRRATAG